MCALQPFRRMPGEGGLMKGRCMSENQPLLEVRQLEVSFFSGKKRTVRTDGVSFSIRPGEILALVGESGCGKSVTALSIPGLLERNGRVTGGEILWQGQDLLRMSEAELDRIRGTDITMVFQDIMYSLNPVLTVGKQMTEGLRKHLRLERTAAWEEAVRQLRRTGIRDAEETMHRYPHQLSGGQRQRVMIAMALCCRPKLLIADEPTTALDVTIQLQIMQLLKGLRDETGLAILLITHDIGLVAETADRVIVMYAGRCVEQADTRQLLSSPAHPYTRALMKAVPGIHDDRSRRLYAIPGAVPENYPDIRDCRFAQRCPHLEACSRRDGIIHLTDTHWVRCTETGIPAQNTRGMEE